MTSLVNLIVGFVFFIQKTATMTLEEYINSDNLISKSLGFKLESKTVRVLAESLLTKEYIDLYKDMLKFSEDDEPSNHVKSRNAPSPHDSTKGRDYRHRHNGHTLELVALRRDKHQAARRDRLVRQSQAHKRKPSKHSHHPAHKLITHLVHKKHASRSG